MKSAIYLAAVLALASATPALAQRGGNRNNGGNNNNTDNGSNLGNGGNNQFGGPGGRTRGGGGNQFNGAGAFAPPGRVRGQPVTLTDDYSILSTTSIFARDRQTYDPTQRPQPVEQTPQPQRQGPAPTFVGVGTDSDGKIAYLTMQNRDGSAVMTPLRPGNTIEWDGSKVSEITIDKLVVTRGTEAVSIPIGYNLRGEAPVAYTAPVFQSLDVNNTGNPAQVSQFTQNQFGPGGFGRGGRNRGGGGAGFGGGGRGNGQFGPGGFGGPGGFNGGFNGGGNGGGNFNQNNINANQLVNPSLDPPLPPGSADDVAARMAARRAQQMGSAGGN